MKTFLQTIIFFFLPFFSFSQQIYLGQDANEVNALIYSEYQSNINSQNYNQVVMQYQPQYNANKEFSDIILCKQNVPMMDIRHSVNFCTHYLINDNKLSSIMIEFSNISLSEVQSAMNSKMSHVGKYWADIDKLPNYVKLYSIANGDVIKEYLNMETTHIPDEILKKLLGIKKKIKPSNNTLQLPDLSKVNHMKPQTFKTKCSLDQIINYYKTFDGSHQEAKNLIYVGSYSIEVQNKTGFNLIIISWEAD